MRGAVPGRAICRIIQIMESDTELLEAWRRGDVDAGEALFERYYRSVHRFFGNKVSRDVDELVQETFAACLEGHGRMKSSNFRAFLFGIAYNVFKTYLRARKKSRQAINFLETSIQDIAPGPSSVLVQRGEQRLLLEGLRRIPLDYQVLLELRYWEQLRTIDMAGVLGIPHPTVRGRLRRAHELLQIALREIATSPDVLRSTVSDLDGWARQCRQAFFDK